jgi:hypothetical protein
VGKPVPVFKRERLKVPVTEVHRLVRALAGASFQQFAYGQQYVDLLNETLVLDNVERLKKLREIAIEILVDIDAEVTAGAEAAVVAAAAAAEKAATAAAAAEWGGSAQEQNKQGAAAATA